MKLKIILISVFVCIVAVFVMISLGIESAFLTKAVRWTEIVIVLSFFAGLVKFLAKEASSIKYSLRELRESFSSKKTSSVLKDVLSSSAENAKKTKLPGTGTQAQSREEKSRLISKLLNSLIILVSAVATFTLGFINPNQSRYTFENIVREQPDFLTETALVFIENDLYLSKFPSKKKLALYISADVSTDFFPSEEMLKSADITLKNYQRLLSENKISSPYADSSDDGITFINPNNMKRVKEIKEKVKSASIAIISDMFPISQELKEWFDTSIASLKQNELTFGLEAGEKNRFEDFKYGGIKIDGSGTELETWITKEKELLRTKSEKLNKEMFRYNNFLTKSRISEMAAEKLSVTGSSKLPTESKKRIAAKFLETGITTSPEIKGFIRWIYRYIFDPLLSSFLALLLLNMLSTVYSRFSVRSYSYCVITIAFIMTLTGLTDQYWLFSQDLISDWNGPMSPGWIMNILAVPVFKALAIGTASGLLFFTAENFYTTFFAGSGDKK
ncbi:hypothetical protein II898_02200 [bacterium]|nr:hypothetical protein [bacterium]